MKIRSKLLLSVMLITAIAYGISVGYLIVKLRSSSLRDSYEKADLHAMESANMIRTFLNRDMDISRTMVHGMRNFKEIPHNLRADFFIKMINGIAIENPDILSVWGSWEAYVMDRNYDKPYGRYRYTYYRENGILKYKEETLNMDGDDVGSGYHNLKLSKKETMIDPYWFAYTDFSDLLLEASTAVPLLDEGRFAGLFGIDIPLARYQEISNQIHPFDGSYSLMLSNNAIIVGYPNQELLGKPFAEYFPNENKAHRITEKVLNGIDFSFCTFDSVSGKEYYATFASIPIGKTDNPWSFGIFVPTDVLLAEAEEIADNSILLSIVGLSILAIVIWIIAYSITKPLVHAKSILSELSQGKINTDKKIILHSGDEIEDISNSINTLVEGLATTANFAREIGKGNLRMKYQTLSDGDVLGESLLSMRESLIQAKEQEELRRVEDERVNWATSGMARFAEILRKNNDNMVEFSYQIISNLVKYIHADIGAIFLLNDDNTLDLHFELVASYAYDRRKYINKRVEIGEGLIGRSAQERETIFLTEVPANYIQVISGLGNDNPSCILVVPLKLNEVVHGVIEFASFEVFDKFTIDFVEKLGESIAATISTVKISIKTVKLLEESKVKSEELASKEEEMRQNMEELQATQEEAARKSAEMESLINALHASSYVIEYDPKGKIISVNNAYLSLTNQVPEQIVGSHHSDNMIMNDKQLSEYKSFWEDLNKGIIKKETTKVNINEKIFTFIETYSPIFNEKHEVIKILKIAHNITDFLENMGDLGKGISEEK
jgi:methyl-accepting chemotaxis protein